MKLQRVFTPKNSIAVPKKQYSYTLKGIAVPQKQKIYTQKNSITSSVMRKFFAALTLLILGYAGVKASDVEVYFENCDNWEEVCIFSWKAGGGVTMGEWPGTKLTETTVVDGFTVYKATVDPANQIIFNCGSSDKQTADLTVIAGNIYRPKSTDDNPTGIVAEQGDYPVLYLRGDLGNSGWACKEKYRFNVDAEGNYSLSVDNLEGNFKIADADWEVEYGSMYGPAGSETVYPGQTTIMKLGRKSDRGYNWNAAGIEDATLTFKYVEGKDLILTITGKGENPGVHGISGTLPVLYINVYQDEEKTAFNNEVIDYNLAHKDYFSFAEYWLDLNGCEWLEAEGAKSVGSADEPLPLEMKARGNWTRVGFSKKPFKLKLGKKQSLLGMTKSKHYAILAHADDAKGYLKNFTGFNLGKRIGLPWTPWQQPIEVVINGNYRGLYFLTESIRVDEDRVNIAELNDNETDASLVSGGYLVELDNYDEVNQIRMPEKSCATGHWLDTLRITWDTPEEYSSIQKQFVTDQFTAMNDNIGANSDDTWKYIDLDDAARYYLVEEIISHTESYHGSTYMFRDRGEGQKWHFSPLWDCGNAYSGSTNNFFYNEGMFGNTWIPSMRENKKFNAKVEETWAWFMQNCMEGLNEEIDLYASHLKAAAEADYQRWHGQPVPNGGAAVVDNREMEQLAELVKGRLADKIEWLKGIFGDYTAMPAMDEPARDTTPAAPLPEYITSSKEEISILPAGEDEIYSLSGMRITDPTPGSVVVIRNNGSFRKVIVK